MSEDGDSGLSKFLMDRSIANPVLGTAFHWYLMIETGNHTAISKMYAKVAFSFQAELAKVSRPTGRRGRSGDRAIGRF